MKCYLLPLGPLEDGFPQTIKYKWSELLSASRDDCIQNFLSNIIENFSLYGENWTAPKFYIKIDDIEHCKVLDFHIKTDGIYVVVNYVSNDKKRLCEHCENENPELISCGTSGGLHLNFGALLISEETHIKFIHKSLE